MIFRRLRLSRAVRKYALLLPGWLARSYGSRKVYSEDQIRRAIAELGLNPKFSDLAFAAYMTEAEYEKLIPVSGRMRYTEARRRFMENLPVPALSHAGNPAAEISVGLDGGLGY